VWHREAPALSLRPWSPGRSEVEAVVAGLCHHELPLALPVKCPRGAGPPLVLPAGDHTSSGQACLGAHCSRLEATSEGQGDESRNTVFLKRLTLLSVSSQCLERDLVPCNNGLV